MGSHRLSCAAALVFSLGLSACSGDDAPKSFPPADYSYLSQLHLNVASINIQDHAEPLPDSLSAKAPTPPDQALKLMATQRLIATGSSGQGDFVITRASIDRSGDNALAGVMDVSLNITDSSGLHTGTAHAQVTRHLDGGDHDPTSRAALYDMTNQMMQDMNVELAFQIRKTMMPWLTDAAGTPLTGAVKEQSLDAPGTTPATIAAPASSPTEPVTAPSTVIAPKASSSAPDAIFPTGDTTDNTGNVTAPAASTGETTAPSPRSPQPGVLKLPGNINPSATPN